MDNQRKISLTAGALSLVIIAFSLGLSYNETKKTSIAPQTINTHQEPKITFNGQKEASSGKTLGSNKYSVRLGTFNNPSYAKKLVQELSKSISGVYIKTVGGKHIVSVDRDNKSDAMKIKSLNKGSLISVL